MQVRQAVERLLSGVTGGDYRSSRDRRARSGEVRDSAGLFDDLGM
jgi:hypothetical protein